ncbi:hypothetical protein MNEG_4605 [Monoraphidium neglectum]|uniref:Kazal-like domain-containing protein n=1 Tax=Monoraphidium neglectum TaxID=145388 RepID=A0A0D2JXI8_9CHLO|nr:hypothetical protein MNEG_4605 [Monoraphidium neglectum]KIZ03353.1 hypothetical protein MNEG_4605 [Monoraphidium neglectum]|eukprot:XP_013902372.1 hypothetical protein MNEG_4605 [Monoraphidium neglectum]
MLLCAIVVGASAAAAACDCNALTPNDFEGPPACGTDGVTYASACLAQCQGVKTRTKTGPCRADDEANFASPAETAALDPSNPLSVLLLYVCANKKPVSAAKARASEPFKGETIEAPADGTTPAAAGGAVTPNFVIGTDDRKFLSPNKYPNDKAKGSMWTTSW